MSSIPLISSSSAYVPMDVVPDGKPCLFDQLPYELIRYLFSDPEFNNPLLEVISEIGLSKMEENFKKEPPIWQVAADQQMRKNIHEKYAFGSGKWKRFFGADVEESPEDSLPLNISRILSRPFNNNWGAIPSRRFQAVVGESKKSVGEMCMLMWMPKDLSINSIGMFVQSRFLGTITGYRVIGDETKKEHGETPIKESYWVILTKDVLDGSEKLGFAKQTALIAELTGINQLDYEVPRALEVIACALAKNLSSKTRLCSENPNIILRCQENVRGYPVVVRGFDQDNLDVYHDHDYVGYECFGVAAALRKF